MGLGTTFKLEGLQVAPFFAYFSVIHIQPDLTGKEVLLLFKKQSPKTRIIVLSCQKNVEVAANLFELGIDDYIVKDEYWKERLLSAMEQTLAA